MGGEGADDWRIQAVGVGNVFVVSCTHGCLQFYCQVIFFSTIAVLMTKIARLPKNMHCPKRSMIFKGKFFNLAIYNICHKKVIIMYKYRHNVRLYAQGAGPFK